MAPYYHGYINYGFLYDGNKGISQEMWSQNTLFMILLPISTSTISSKNKQLLQVLQCYNRDFTSF